MQENQGISVGGGEKRENPIQPQVNMGRQSDAEEHIMEQKRIQENKDKIAKELSQQHGVSEEFVDTEFIVPTDIVDLPSKGLFYPNGQKQLEVKYLTAEDENILTSPDLIKSGKALDVLLDNAIVDKSLDSSQLITGDRNAVLINLRVTGYGDDYEVKTTCPSCGNIHTSNVILSQLKNKDIELKPDSEGMYSVTLPRCKANIRFRMLTGADEDRLKKLTLSKAKLKGGKTSVSKVLTEKYLLQIMEVNGKTDKLYIKKFISVMPIADSLFFREYLSNVEPGIDLKYGFTCDSCGHDYEQEVPITAKLFWPNANI
jgi:hypothetical protein